MTPLAMRIDEGQREEPDLTHTEPTHQTTKADLHERHRMTPDESETTERCKKTGKTRGDLGDHA